MKNNRNLTGRDIARHIRPELLKFGLISAAGPEMAQARALAAQLIGPAIVSTETLDRVQAYTEAAVWTAHEDGALIGVLAFVLLNRAGAEAVLRGEFDAVDPAIGHMASPDQVVRATYGWGICATGKEAARRLVGGSFAIMPWFDHLPRYARPTTEAGHRLMRERMGYADLPGSDGLVWAPPLARPHTVAAAA
jgi:hypothetical protein